MTRTNCLLPAIALLAACGTDNVDGPTTIKGVITRDAMWSGVVGLEGFVTIEPGVVVTVAAGTTIEVASAASIEVGGVLDVQGTKADVVTIAPRVTGQYWLGITVPGTVTMRYATQTGGGIYTTTASASATITDSELSNALGDFLVVNDGNLDVQYSTLGFETGDHTHCNVHINAAKTIRFTHNNNVGVAYGLMLYGGRGDFSHNNWIGNAYDIEPNPGGTGTFDDSYFAKGIPSGVPGSTFEQPSSIRLVDCGPR